MKSSASVVYALLLAALCLDAGCSGDKANPVSPGTGTGGSSTSSCRTYASATTGVSASGSYTLNTSTTCSYNTATNRLDCTYRTSDSNGASSVSTGVVIYASPSDFVAEVQVVPPLRRSLGVTTSETGSAPDVALVSTYDGRNRLTRDVLTSAGGTVTTTYSTWDGSGRPTAGAMISARPLQSSGRTTTAPERRRRSARSLGNRS